MAPVKPMGINPPGSKPGVTGFPQKYNDQPPPAQDLNPDAVTDPDAMPEPQATPRSARKGRTARKAR